MTPGQIIYIEARTGNGKHNSPDLFVKGRYEFVREDDSRIWLKEERIVFPVMKDRIDLIDVNK